MNTSQICTEAINRYFPTESEAESAYRKYSTPTQPPTLVNYLPAGWYSRSANLVNVSSSTAPGIYKRIQYIPEFSFRRMVVDDLSAYLGIIECKVLAGGDSPSNASIFDRLENTTELSSYLLNIYDLELAKRHRAASKLIFKYIETHFAVSDLLAVDGMLGVINLEKLSPWSISGLIRFTGRARSHLPSWSTVYHHAKTLLAKQGYEAEKLLAGIGE